MAAKALVSKLGRKAVDILQTNIDRLEVELAQKEKFDERLSKLSIQLARGVSGLLSEVRKLEESEAERVLSLSYQEQSELLIEEISELPTEYKEKILSRLASH